VNVNDRNGVRTALQDALGGKPVTLDNPRVPANELLACAEELKPENPRYHNVNITQIGPNRIKLQLQFSDPNVDKGHKQQDWLKKKEDELAEPRPNLEDV
jgi:hypothetical protein